MSNEILETGIRQVKNVGSLNFGAGALDGLPREVSLRRARAGEKGAGHQAVFLVDEFFLGREEMLARLGADVQDRVEFVSTQDEPTTDGIDERVARLKEDGFVRPAVIVGVGGGITLDTTKAVANLLTNDGPAEQYLGWDLVRIPGIPKIGVPTISGTGAEATRTCVMTNTQSGLKLGMNSDFTVFDHVILDPDLTATVPRAQYF